MNYLKRYSPILMLYLLGINLYFCFWYLGSEGEVLSWSHGQLAFNSIILLANASVPVVFTMLLFARKSLTKVMEINYFKINFLLQSFLSSFLFSSVLLFWARSHSSELMQDVRDYLGTSSFLSFSIYHFTLSMLLVASLNLLERLGSIRKVMTYLLQWVNPPQEVDRCFLFIDLNNSTSIAEGMESDAFSRLLRDCFKLLNQVIDKYEGIEVYQYVGDEAIVHWDYQNRVACIKGLCVFEEFKEMLDRHAEHFQLEHRTFPTFKAAIHGGIVTRSEIGLNIMHTAFHGDVLNTTSRILDLCKPNETDFLVSAGFHQKIQFTLSGFGFEKIERTQLKGRAGKMPIYKVERLAETDEPLKGNDFNTIKQSQQIS